MTADFSDGVPTISRDTVSEFLLAIPYGNDTLAVSVPGKIVDSA